MFTGIDSPYEEPLNYDIMVSGDTDSDQYESTKFLYDSLTERNIFKQWTGKRKITVGIPPQM